MKIVDANIILRYLLNDVEELTSKAYKILLNNKVFIPYEVVAEVIYVLESVYNIERVNIYNELIDLLKYKNTSVHKQEIILKALELYKNRKLDFVDCLLYAYHIIDNHIIFTFDKKLLKLIESE